MLPTTQKSSSPATERFFGSSHEVLKETSRLGSLMEFDSILHKLPAYLYKRQKLLERAAQVWQQVLDSPTVPLDDLKRRLVQELEPDRKIMSPSASQFFTAKIHAINTPEEMQKLARRVLKDCTSAMVSPVKKSQAGLNGPTFLVSYPKSNLKAKFSLIAYVLKCTNLEEVCGNMLYTSFLTHFGQKSFSEISIPKHSGFNFEHNMHKTEDGRLVLMDPQTASALKTSLHSVASSLDPAIKLYGKELLVTERIQGETLYDFAKSKYAALDGSQRRELFYKLGKLVPLDILIGNNDRLLKLDIGGVDFLNTFHANLGNVMLSQETVNGNPIVHAIDNGLEADLSSNTQTQKRYLEIIQTIFSMPDSEQALAKSMTRSFKDALKSQAIEEKRNAGKETLAQLEPLFKDLQTIVQPAFEAGIQDGIAMLRKELIPAWNSDRSAELKRQLAILHPALLKAVDERLTAITKETV